MSVEESNQERLLTVTEVANWLNVSTSLIYQMVDAGNLVTYRIGNRAIRFRREDIESYLEAGRSKNHQPQSNEKKVFPKLRHLDLGGQGTSEASGNGR